MTGTRSAVFAMIVLAGIFGRVEKVTAGKDHEVATLAGGCFWCLEAVFEELQGVQKVESGFSGGDFKADYEEVCTGQTGHAEVVQITFDPGVVSYADLLAVFFSVHDPTTLDRQGGDVGSQYRSAVFYHDENQKAVAEKAVAALTEQKVWPNPVVTEITPFDRFFKADAHHQDYYRRNRNQGYCRVVINPKLEKFRREFSSSLKK